MLHLLRCAQRRVWQLNCKYLFLKKKRAKNTLSRIAAMRRANPQLPQPPALYDPYQNHHNRDDQEDMNHSAHTVRSDETRKRQDSQDDCSSLDDLEFTNALAKPIDVNQR